MSFVSRAAQRSPRLIAIGLFIVLVSTIVTASEWDRLSAFAESFGVNFSARPASAGGQNKSAPVDDFVKTETLLTPGTCDTAGPIEVEGSILGSTPTAYATLGAAFTAINAGTHTGAITIDVCGDTTEAAIASLSASGAGSASYTAITISPAGGAARTITGNLASELIILNGADNVTIDGLNTGGNSLTIQNTSTASTSGTSTIKFIADATANTVTNSSILGSATIAVSTGTNGGNIWFAAGAITTGSDNNVISNNNIGPAGANLPSRLIWGNGSTTNAAVNNSGIQITNNNLFDFFNATAQSRAVDVAAGNTDWTISNNRIYQTAPRVWTTGAEMRGISISNSASGNNFQVTGNTVGFASAAGTGTLTISGGANLFKGIHLIVAATTASNIQNNTVANISQTTTASGTTTSAPFMALYPQTGLITTTGNTIGSPTGTGSISFSSSSSAASDVLGIFNFSSQNSLISNNNLGSITATNSSTGVIVLYGIRTDLVAAVTATVTGNTIGGTTAASLNNTATATGSRVIGAIHVTGLSAITGNTIRNATMAAANTGPGASASVIGIAQTSTAAGQNISQNTISGLSNTNATVSVGVIGISHSAATTGSTNIVARNFIHSLSTPSTAGTATVTGINVSGGVTTYQNNMIALGEGLTNGPQINGINETSGTDNFYHNSVYIGGTNAAAFAGSTFAFSSTTTISTRNYRDNIFYNARSNGAGTGKHYAIRVGGTAVNPSGLTSNNNVLFASGTGGFTGLFNAVDQATLANWQTATGNDGNSFSANPQYNDPTNATPDLHLHPTNATVAEGNGVSVGVADDFDGQTRSGLTPTDIGADAGNYNGVDLAAPAISYTPLGNTASTANRVLSVTITDTTGVATGGNAPRVYFNKNAGTYFSTACALTSGTVNNGVWDCTIDNSLIGGVVAADVVRFFVVAQDANGNLAANPGGGFSGTNVNTVATPPAAPNQYLISTAFTGSFNVGTGETFTSLTNAGGIFEAINNGVLTGNVTINLTTDLTGELGTNALNQFAEDGVGGYTLLIKPAGGPRSVTGSNSGALIRLNGADRVRIDGSTAASLFDEAVGGTPALRELTIQNTNTGTSATVISVASNATNGAQNNTIKNVNILGQDPTTTLLGISLGGATPGTVATGPNNGNRVENCSLKRAITGIWSAGVSAASQNTGTVITQNETSDVTADRLRRVGIVVFNENGVQITENSLNGISTNESADAVGIGVGIQALDNTTTTTGGVSNALVSRNKVNGVASLSTTGFSAAGITVAGTTGGANTISNNMVTGVTAPSTSPDLTAGIFVAGATGASTRLYYNAVAMSGDRGAVASQMPGFGVAITGTDPAVELKNNIFSTTQTASGGGVNAKSYAIGLVTTTFVNLDSNYNLFYSAGANAGFYRSGSLGAAAGTDYAAIAAWRTAVSDDANSIGETDPLFVNPLNDLHLQVPGPAIDTGTAVAAVTTDFDGTTRPQGVAPEIGADEVVPAVPGTIQFSAATYAVTEGTPTVTLTVTRSGGSSGAVTANYTFGGGTATGGASCGGGVDYDNAGGSVIFADGDAADKTFTVAICNDALFEANETFDATLAIGSGTATLGTPNPATVTINENDTAPTVQFSSATYTNSDDLSLGAAGATITVTRTGATENAFSVNYATANGTATGGAGCGSGADYISTSGTLNFAAGESSKFFTITVCSDLVFEGSETVNLALTSPTVPAVLGSPSAAVLTLTDNETVPSLQFSAGTYTNSDDVAQFGVTTDELTPSVATITVTRTGATGNAVSVNYVAGGGGTAFPGASCTAGVDFLPVSGTLNFAAGDVSKTFDVTVCTDALFEGDETVALTLSNPTAPAALGMPNTAILTITDNDAQPSLQFSAATYSVSEAGPTVTITVNRSGAADNAVAVVYATGGGTANGAGSCGASIDYIQASGSLSFAAGELSKTFTVAICDDAVADPAETVNLTLSSPSGGAVLGAQSSAVLTINDNDAADYSVTTTGNAIVVTDNKDNGEAVNITEPAGGQIMFAATGRTFQIDGGTVISGNSGSLPLAGVTSVTFNGQGGNDIVTTAAFTTALPNLTVNGGTGNDTVNFNGSLNFVSNANLDVDLQNDDAAPGTDIINVNPSAVLALSGTGTATFKASQSVTINNLGQVGVVNGNLTVEANQQATPTTGNFRGVSLNGGTLTTGGTGNISVKGKGGSGAFGGLRGVIVSNGAITSTQTAVGAGTITIVGTGGPGIGSNGGVEINGSANAVTSSRGDISITGQGGTGTTTLNVGVLIGGPAGVRSTGPAKVTINGTGGSGTNSNAGVRIIGFGAEVASAGGDITINGNGAPGATGLSSHGISVVLGARVSSTNGAKITLNGNGGGGSAGIAGVNIGLADGTMPTVFAKIVSDLGDISITGVGGTGAAAGGGGNIGVNVNGGGSVVGTNAANISITGTGGECTDPAANDCYGVDFESANAVGTAVTTANGSIAITGTATATTGLRQNGIRFEDSVGTQPFTMTTGSGSVTLNAASASTDPSSAALTFADDTTLTSGGANNTFNADTMAIGTSQVSINAGANTLALKPQTAARPVDLGGADSAATLGLSDAELDVMTAGTLNIGTAATGNVYLTSNISRSSATAINLVSGASIGAITGSLDSGGGNINATPAAFAYASNSGVDFTTGAGSTFKIANGQTLRLAIGAAVVDSGYEQLNVAGRVDISGVTLSLDALAVPTGGESFTIINNDGADAITGSFVGLPEGTVIPNFFGSGLNATITYVGGSGNDCVITVTPGASTLQFSAATGSIGENGGTITLTVTRTGSTTIAAAVDYATANGTATGGASCAAGVDFVNTNGTLNFAAGDTSKTFNVTVCNDALFESNETFDATLSNATGGAALGSPSTETVTIIENDTAPTAQFSSATYSTTETLGDSGIVTGATITVTRTGATENAFSVNYATANGTATGGASCAPGVDYLSVSGTLNFAGGETTKTFFVATCSDTVFEGDETVNLTLSGPTAPAVLGTPNAAVLTIVENDAQPTVKFTSATYTDDESQTIGIGIVRTGDTSGTTTVNFATANGTATGGASCSAGVDYVINAGTVTFNPTVTSQTVMIQLCGDGISEAGETINLTLSGASAPATLGTPNTAVLTINDTASQYRNQTDIDLTGTVGSPYPANIVVSGGPVNVGTIKVTLYDINHNLADDLDILLVGPGGQKMVLMADAGGSTGLVGPATITFDDQAGQVLPDNGTISTGRYEPTSWELGQASFPAPAPGGPYSEPGSAVGGPTTLASVFSGTPANGTWSLFTHNDVGALVPIGGNIVGGWGLQILAPTAANAEIGGRVTTANGQGIRNATVILSGGSLAQPITVRTGTFGSYKFSDLPVGQTYVVTILLKRYRFAEPTRIIDLTDSVTSADFVANPQ
jgi:trimeric autotransporter adhesin